MQALLLLPLLLLPTAFREYGAGSAIGYRNRKLLLVTGLGLPVLPAFYLAPTPQVGVSRGRRVVRIHFELQNSVYDLVKSEEERGGARSAPAAPPHFSAR